MQMVKHKNIGIDLQHFIFLTIYYRICQNLPSIMSIKYIVPVLYSWCDKVGAFIIMRFYFVFRHVFTFIILHERVDGGATPVQREVYNHFLEFFSKI